eukprot:CAMPEP_0197194584 /NCGR_PEP_ID=MMETSP1423-20130617/29517_1 /TAXON_ID=476441 /ORGANISM="Pseudo-nitzschia heimii, Strain UNC1101" /LENGTH=616 /DNA_ID=CAMNT_0042648031 /DNA_START=127 /DNA_END=1977 /DNA_ORIENTATION=+
MAPQIDSDHDESYFPPIDRRTVSFFDESHYPRDDSFYQRLLRAAQKEEWAVVSPMTRHVIPSDRNNDELVAAKLPRRRSRSFDQYIESRERDVAEIPTIASLKLGGIKTPKPSRRKEKPDSGSDSDSSSQKDVYSEADDMPFYMSVLFGAINCMIVLPVIMSFGNIIYRDDAFAEYMPVLIKLTMVSGMVHQLCFSIFSTLKFAVGSVQDAGLIFLSKMAADMVVYCRVNNHDDETMLATVTVGLGGAAAALGVGLIIISKFGLASYVQMLPTCVVAGYLAFIGWFVGFSGLGIMAGVSSVTPGILWERLVFVFPGVAGGAFIYLMVRKLRHIAVLPICITGLLVVFYVALAVTGSTIEEATDTGWIRKSESVPAWNETWDYLKIDKVVWGAYPQLWLTWLGMLFVVALSSSLDVAAIELEMKKPLNYNQELRVVGISNMISGLTGGYTGSYIFSQTIFSLRIGVRSRIPGFAVAFFSFVVIVMPFPVLSYVPNFFYGSLLSMICIDLMYEWLWEFKNKVTTAEYLIGLSTFGLIQALGVEYGIVAGVVVYVICRQLKFDLGELKKVQNDDDNEDDCIVYDRASFEDIFEDPEEEIEQETTRLTVDNDGRGSYITF